MGAASAYATSRMAVSSSALQHQNPNFHHDVEANKEMRLYIEKVVNAAGEKTKLEMELFTERQIQNCIKEIRQVVKEEVQNYTYED